MGAPSRFRAVAHETGGSLLEFDFYLRAGGVIAVDHLHPRQEERFEVISGLMRGHVGGRPETVGPGGTSVVAPGVPHAWWNAGDGDAHLRVQFRPALRTEELFEAVFALGREGRTGRRRGHRRRSASTRGGATPSGRRRNCSLSGTASAAEPAKTTS